MPGLKVELVLTVAGSDNNSDDAEVLRSDDNDVSPVRTAPSSVSSCDTDLQSRVIPGRHL